MHEPWFRVTGRRWAALRVRAGTAVVIAALTGVSVSSCFSERQESTGPLPAGECRIPTSSPAAGTVVIFIRNFTFIPQSVTVKRGTKVTWVNCEDDSADPHTSTSDAGLWDSPTLRSGDTYSRTFDTAGTRFDYHCVPHPFMKGTVEVE